MSKPKTDFDQALEDTKETLDEIAQETLTDPEIQKALDDDSVDESW